MTSPMTPAEIFATVLAHNESIEEAGVFAHSDTRFMVSQEEYDDLCSDDEHEVWDRGFQPRNFVPMDGTDWREVDMDSLPKILNPEDGSLVFVGCNFAGCNMTPFIDTEARLVDCNLEGAYFIDGELKIDLFDPEIGAELDDYDRLWS